MLGVFAKARALNPAPVLVLMAMEAPPNLGDAYTRRFHAVYAEVARETGATLIPFFLDGIAGVDSLNQPDGITRTRAARTGRRRTHGRFCRRFYGGRRERGPTPLLATWARMCAAPGRDGS